MERKEILKAVIAEFESLDINWDSYGASKINKYCIDAAISISETLPPGDWFAVPTPSGGVQIELSEGGIDVEILISPA